MQVNERSEVKDLKWHLQNGYNFDTNPLMIEDQKLLSWLNRRPILKDNYKLRKFKSNDTNFILNSWMLSNRSRQKDMDNIDYFAETQRYIEIVLKRADVIIFCSPDDEDHLFGYVVYESHPAGHIIHFAYLKQPYRGFGLFRSFAEETFTKDRPIYITHKPKDLAHLKAVHNVSYDPYLIWS